MSLLTVKSLAMAALLFTVKSPLTVRLLLIVAMPGEHWRTFWAEAEKLKTKNEKLKIMLIDILRYL